MPGSRQLCVAKPKRAEDDDNNLHFVFLCCRREEKRFSGMEEFKSSLSERLLESLFLPFWLSVASHRNIIYISFFVPLHVLPLRLSQRTFFCSCTTADWDEDDKKRRKSREISIPLKARGKLKGSLANCR